MSIPSVFHDLRKLILPSHRDILEQLLFPESLPNRDTICRSPHADFLLEIGMEFENIDGEATYQLFDRYIPQLNTDFANWLNEWGKTRLLAGERVPAIEEILDNLNTLWNFPRGDQVNNLEISLICNQLQLLFVSRKADAKSWARIQNNLGNTFRNRVRGDDIGQHGAERSENLEQSIWHYQQALEVYNKAQFPLQWAMTQNNLASAYLFRIRGQRSANIDQSIAYYHRALEVYTKEEFPIDWATTQNNLGNAYNEIVLNDLKSADETAKAENLQLSVACYQRALEVYTKSNFPIQWATTQNNLASAYLADTNSDSKNIDQCIFHYLAALEIFKKDNFPIQWAMTQNNLGNAYRKQTNSNLTANIEKSIGCYERALQIRTKEEFPIDWAVTHSNLGNAYRERRQGQAAENLEKSIQSYEQALPIIAVSAFAQQLALLKNNLANAYRQRQITTAPDIVGTSTQSLRQFVQSCCDQADWERASLGLDLWFQSLMSQKLTAAAIYPLLLRIGLSAQYQLPYLDEDLQKLVRIVPAFDWQPADLVEQWHSPDKHVLITPMPPLTPEVHTKICMAIGVVSIQQQQLAKGLDWLKCCWDIQQTTNDREGLAESSFQLAIGQHIAGNLNLAGVYFRDSLLLFQKLNDSRKVAFCHHGLGRILLQTGQIDAAITEFEKALSILITMPNRSQVPARIKDIQRYLQAIAQKPAASSVKPSPKN